MNPLDQYPAVRSAFYLLQWVVNGILSIAGVIFLTLGTPVDQLPQWYVLALAIAPVLWTYLGVTAQRNVPSYQDVVQGEAPPPARDDRGSFQLLPARRYSTVHGASRDRSLPGKARIRARRGR